MTYPKCHNGTRIIRITQYRHIITSQYSCHGNITPTHSLLAPPVASSAWLRLTSPQGTLVWVEQFEFGPHLQGLVGVGVEEGVPVPHWGVVRGVVEVTEGQVEPSGHLE